MLSLLSTYIILEDFGPCLLPQPGKWTMWAWILEESKQRRELTDCWVSQASLHISSALLCSWNFGSLSFLDYGLIFLSRTCYWSLFETQLKCFITFFTLYCNFIQAWGQKLYVGHLNITKHSAQFLECNHSINACWIKQICLYSVVAKTFLLSVHAKYVPSLGLALPPAWKVYIQICIARSLASSGFCEDVLSSATCSLITLSKIPSFPKPNSYWPLFSITLCYCFL